MRRSSIFLLLGAVLLGLLAVVAARNVLSNNGASQAAPETPMAIVVMAAKPMKFGDKISADMLKTAPWPGSVPAGSFAAIREAVGDGERTALREIKEGELILPTAITGGAGRLASSTLLGPDMRAVSIPVSETSGAGGFLAPGDRVDVFLTREFGEEAAYAGAIIQGARVLAIGQMADPSQSEPVVVKSVTIEVTPPEAQKIALAQTVGEIHLALRATGDESRVPIQTASAIELFGMRPPASSSQASPAPAAPAPAATGPRPIGGGTEVRVVRGTESTSYQVPR